MSIIYGLIARDRKTILVDYSFNQQSNIQSVVYEFLEKLKPLQNNQPTHFVSADRFTFYTLPDDEFLYLCVAENSYPQDIATQFLQKIRGEFTKAPLYERQNAIAYGFNTTFQDTLMRTIKEFNTNVEGLNQVYKLKQQTNEITSVLIKNIDNVLIREQNIEIAVIKTTKMNESSLHIKKQATQARRDAYWRSMRVKIFIAVIILAFIVTAFIML